MDLTYSSGGDTSQEDSATDDNDLDSEVEVFPLDEGDVGTDEESEADYDHVGDSVNGSSCDEDIHDKTTRAWGSKKSHFYNANEEDSSGDELEEGEVRTLQQKMQATLHEEDFTSHWFQEDMESTSSQLQSVPLTSSESKEHLSEVLMTFDSHLKWLVEFGLPAIQSCGEWNISPHGYKYLYCKVHVLFCYCINVLHYLYHKMQFNNETFHSNRISELNELLLQVSDADQELERVIQEPSLLKIPNLHGMVNQSIKKKATFELPDNNALHFYEMVKQSKVKKRRLEESCTEPVADGVDEGGKRAITFEMARNKGLTPSRKKEQRNPRVKHRKKYRKALLKRKSQVLPVMPELTKYGGEGSGIRSRLARSVPLK